MSLYSIDIKALGGIMTKTHYSLIACATILSFLISCGGSSYDSDSTTTTTPTTNSNEETDIAVTGTIDGFGSIYVNGIKFDTDSALVTIDSEQGQDSDLRLGMVVTIKGKQGSDDSIASASEIEFDDDVQGPVSAINEAADGNSKLLTILGVSVLVDRVTTVIDDTSFDTIAIDDVLEVSGFYDANNILNATRIEKKQNFVAGISEIELKGIVSNLTANEFILGDYTVDYSNADLSEVPNATLTDGMGVEVKGTLSGTLIIANRVEQEDDVFADADKVSIEGFITDFIDINNFIVAGIPVDASGAQLVPQDLNLQNGVKVEAEGPIVDGILVAISVEARGGDIELSASISAVEIDAITLDFIVGNVTVTINSQTQLRDQTDTFATLSIENLQVGDFLEIRARLNGNEIVATELRLDEMDDNIIVAQVESFVATSEITLLGLSFNTQQAEFENLQDQPISSSDFFSQLQVGTLIKIEDKEIADGIADEVEFED